MSGAATHRQPWLLVGLVIAVTISVAGIEWVLVNVTNPDPQWDLEVYRGAIDTWTGGGSLYDYRLDHPAREGGFPFTYPPFAALVLLPMTWLPVGIADGLWSIGSILLTVAMAAFVVWRAPRTDATWLGPTPSRAILVGFTAAGTLILLLTFPAIHNIVLGQVSFLITALMLFDIGGLAGRRTRGVLSGLAAAIKLTPLVTFPYYLVTRQFRAAILVIATFVAACLVALAILPKDSVAYWTDHLFNAYRVGDPATIQNKSILGLLSRWDIGGPWLTAIWIILAAAVLTAALWQARRQYERGALVGAALIVGCASVSVSPISWPHHQAWIILVAIWLLLQRRPLFMVLGASIILVNLAGSPLMGQEVFPDSDAGPLVLQLAREIPTLAFLAVCLLGLPTSSLPTPSLPAASPPASGNEHGTMTSADPAPASRGD